MKRICLRKGLGHSVYLSRPQVAEMLCLKTATLRTWVSQGRGPSFVKMGSGRSARVLYPLQEVERYLLTPVTYQPPGGLAKQRRRFPAPQVSQYQHTQGQVPTRSTPNVGPR